jgi:predicted Zn-dependent protease
MKKGQAKVEFLSEVGQHIVLIDRAARQIDVEITTKRTPLITRESTHRCRITRMDRVALLNEVLSQNPSDAFARYGLAMEYSKTGEIERALEEFGKLLATHPDYTAGYFMAAQTLAKVDRTEEAKKMLADGIASAKNTGNGHAQAEMEAMLGELG